MDRVQEKHKRKSQLQSLQSAKLRPLLSLLPTLVKKICVPTALTICIVRDCMTSSSSPQINSEKQKSYNSAFN